MEPNREFAACLERALFTLRILPLDEHVIFGSAVMRLHRLKDCIGDVDLFVSPRGYARLRDSGLWTEQRPRWDDPPLLESPEMRELGGLRLHAFYAWASRDRWIDAPEAFAKAERVCGVMCVPLELVAFYKQASLELVRYRGLEVAGSPWEKHEHDLAMLAGAGVTVNSEHAVALTQGFVELMEMTG